MKKKTQMEILELLVERANIELNRPTTPYTRVDGKLESNAGCMFIDSAYGGWQINQMCKRGGCSHVLPSGGGYLSKPKLESQLRAFLAGIDAAKRAAIETNRSGDKDSK